MVDINVQKTVADAAGSAVSTVYKDSILGALLIICIALLVWLIRRVLSVQDQRVDDQKQMSERLEKSQDRQTALLEKTGEAFLRHEASMQRQIDVLTRSTEEVAGLSSSVRSMQGTVDSVVRDAVRSRPRGSGG